MKKYLQASLTNLVLDRKDIQQIESDLRVIIRDYFYDNGHTDGVRITESEYDILRFTARTYSNYSGMSSRPTMNEDRESLNAFRLEVRRYLKQYGVTKVKFDLTKSKAHYGYISGPDDFPVVVLKAIYFG